MQADDCFQRFFNKLAHDDEKKAAWVSCVLGAKKTEEVVAHLHDLSEGETENFTLHVYIEDLLNYLKAMNVEQMQLALADCHRKEYRSQDFLKTYGNKPLYRSCLVKMEEILIDVELSEGELEVMLTWLTSISLQLHSIIDWRSSSFAKSPLTSSAVSQAQDNMLDFFRSSQFLDPEQIAAWQNELLQLMVHQLVSRLQYEQLQVLLYRLTSEAGDVLEPRCIYRSSSTDNAQEKLDRWLTKTVSFISSDWRATMVKDALKEALQNRRHERHQFFFLHIMLSVITSGGLLYLSSQLTSVALPSQWLLPVLVGADFTVSAVVGSRGRQLGHSSVHTAFNVMMMSTGIGLVALCAIAKDNAERDGFLLGALGVGGLAVLSMSQRIQSVLMGCLPCFQSEVLKAGCFGLRSSQCRHQSRLGDASILESDGLSESDSNDGCDGDRCKV